MIWLRLCRTGRNNICRLQGGMMQFRFGAGLLSIILTVAGWGQAGSTAPASPTASSQQETTQRPTSTPYSGDLSIFEYPGRDKKLQIDRVMDLLGITQGKNVADIGAG